MRCFRPGDEVIYVPRHARGNRDHEDCAHGVVAHVGSKYILVRFGNRSTSYSCSPEDLVHAARQDEPSDWQLLARAIVWVALLFVTAALLRGIVAVGAPITLQILAAGLAIAAAIAGVARLWSITGEARRRLRESQAARERGEP